MYQSIAVLLLMGAGSCNNDTSQQDFSTVDSNVAGRPDSIPATLYLDTNTAGHSFSIAMDSAGPTVEPKDTTYPDKR